METVGQDVIDECLDVLWMKPEDVVHSAAVQDHAHDTPVGGVGGMNGQLGSRSDRRETDPAFCLNEAFFQLAGDCHVRVAIRSWFGDPPSLGCQVVTERLRDRVPRLAPWDVEITDSTPQMRAHSKTRLIAPSILKWVDGDQQLVRTLCLCFVNGGGLELKRNHLSLSDTPRDRHEPDPTDQPHDGSFHKTLPGSLGSRLGFRRIDGDAILIPSRPPEVRTSV